MPTAKQREAERAAAELEEAEAIALADEKAELLVEHIFADAEETGTCAVCVCYALFLAMVSNLVELGYSSEELQRDVVWHAARSEGPLQ